jgi:hypothetical protein
MDETAAKQSVALGLAGGIFLALAGLFLWRDLALPRELGALAVTLVAGAAAVLGVPRRWPVLAPSALLAATLGTGLWFLAEMRPGLLAALAAGLLAATAAVLRAEGGPPQPGRRWADQLTWYALGAAFLVGTWAFYLEVLTLGLASESVARRLVPTVVWLACGLFLFVVGRRWNPAAVHTGLGLSAVAIVKAAAYDTTHLAGPARVIALALVGALLLAAAAAHRPKGAA